MNRWREGYLTHEEVVRLLESGCRWSVTYCVGSNLSPVSGRGGSLPAGGLERVPTQAAKRKLQRGNGGKTYFRAEISLVLGLVVISYFVAVMAHIVNTAP